MKTLKSLIGKELTSIDIGSYNTKIVQGTIKKNKIHVSRACYFPTPNSSYRDGEIYDFDKIATAIKEVMNNRKFKLNIETVCTLESSSIISTEIVIPYAKEREMIQAVEFEIDQYLPIDNKKYVIDYKLLEVFKEKELKKARVSIRAIPIDIANGYFHLLTLLKCRPYALDINANSVSKFTYFSLKEKIKNKTISVIDLGYEHINIIIIQDGVLKYNRLLNLGSKNLDIFIANALNIYIKEAEEKKLESNNIINIVAEDTESYAIENNIRLALTEWLDSIERIFKFCLTRGFINEIDSIFIYGGSSNLPGIVELFKEHFDIETSKIENVGNIYINEIDGYYSKDFTYYVNALGSMVGR